MYIIGLIDDEEEQLRKIRRTIKAKVRELGIEYEFDFKSYNTQEDKALSAIFDEIILDIEEKKIASLIIDYKIMNKAHKIWGTEIFKRIKDSVSMFPVIILTEVVEASIEPEYIDADKVYEKKQFFAMKDYTNEKVGHIFDSMVKYISQRDVLSLNIIDLKKNLSDGNRDVIPEILKLEEQLAKFMPMDISIWDSIYTPEKIGRISELIEKANKLMGTEK